MVSFFFCGVSPAQTIPDDWTPIPPPIPRSDSPWLVSDFLEDGDLYYKSIFHIAFESNGTAWIACTEGLYKYDGYVWTLFTEKDGLPSRFIRCLLVTRDNHLWVATDRGAGIFDGKTFKSYLSELYLAGPSVRRMVEEPDGTIWFCCDPWPDTTLAGGLTSKKDGIWKTYRVEDGLPSKYIKNFFRDSQKRLFVLTDVGLVVYENGQWTQPLKDWLLPGKDQAMWDIAESPNNEVIVSNRDSLFILRNNQWIRRPNLPDMNSARKNAYRFCTTRDGQIFSCQYIDEEHLSFQAWNGEKFVSVSNSFPVLRGSVDCVKEAPDGSIWAVGFNTVFRWSRSGGEWRQFDTPKPTLTDSNNWIWFTGEKTLVYDRNQWFRIDYFQGQLALDANQKVWGWSKKGVYHWNDGKTIYSSPEKVGLQKIDALTADRSNTVWASGVDAKKGLGIRSFDGAQWIDRTPDAIETGTVVFCHPDPQEGIWYLIEQNAKDKFIFYHLSNKQVKQTIPGPALSIDKIKDFAVDPTNRDLWIYGSEGIIYYDNYTPKPAQWIHLTGLADCEVFAAIFQENREWFGVQHKSNLGGSIYRLHQGKNGWDTFDCNAQFFGLLDLSGIAYFGGKGSIFSLSPQIDAPRSLAVPENKPVRWLVSERNGNLWIQTDDAVLRYQPDKIPPETLILNSIKEAGEGETLRFHFSGKERFVPRAQRRNIYYSWQINANSWSSFQDYPQDELSLVGLKPGNYILRVRSLDEDGDIDPSPSITNFYIHPLSIQDTRWFKIGAVIIFVLISVLAVYAFRARKKLSHYAKNLEKMVEQRTQSLRETEAKYLHLFENVPDSIIIWDPESLQIIDVNNAAVALYGYTRNEFLALKATDVSAEPEETANAIRRMVTQHKTDVPLRYHKKKDGTVFPLEISGGMFTLNGRLSAFGIFRNITERKQIEKRLRFHTTILENMTDWVTTTDANFHITYVSPSVKEVLGYRPDELIGKTTVEAYGKPRVLTCSWGTLLNGIKAGHWQGEVINTTRSGQKIIVSLHIGALRDENGVPSGTISVARDITALKQMEEQLIQSQKIKAIGQLAGGVSHDFNNLLTGIIGNLSMALVRSDNALRPFLKNAEEAANRAAELVKQLLAFSRKSQIELKPLNLNDVIGEVFTLIRHTIDRRIDIVLKKEEHLPNVMADKAQLISALMNLCVNARDAIEEIISGGAFPHRRNDSFQITIQTQSVVFSEEDCRNHPQTQTGRYVCVSVIDNGVGMSSEIQQHMFEPFYTTKDVDKGTGLGLSSVYGTITQHNGWIEPSGVSGAGAAFRMYLPVSDIPLDQSPAALESSLRGGEETILIVDDEEMILKLGEAILDPLGYRILLAQDGREALNIASDHKQSIDLVLLDISMPKQSGWDVLRELKIIQPSVKVIMCSGYSQEELANSANLTIPHLPKPYKPDTLVQTVRDVLDGV